MNADGEVSPVDDDATAAVEAPPPAFDGPAVLRSAVALALVAGVVFGISRALNLRTNDPPSAYGEVPAEWEEEFRARFYDENFRGRPWDESLAVTLALANHQHSLSMHFVPILSALPPGEIDNKAELRDSLYAMYAELQSTGIEGHLQELRPFVTHPLERDALLGIWVQHGDPELRQSWEFLPGGVVGRRGSGSTPEETWDFATDRLTITMGSPRDGEPAWELSLRLHASSPRLLVWIRDESRGPEETQKPHFIVWERFAPPEE